MTFAKKTRKLFRAPGLFVRDALLNRYPVELSDRVETVKLVRNIQVDSKPKQANSLVWDNLSERLIIADKLAVTFPVDIVFTWVDAEDPNFIETYNKYVGRAGKRKEVSDIARFQNIDELKFALRSINDFAPWVRNIYIVTNGQVPSWLNLKHPQIHVVSHEQILEKKYLPTFNSHVIESAIHNIPGISEHYLYFNDDMMLTRPVTPEYFFGGSGLAYMFISKTKLPNTPVNQTYDSPTEWGAKNARDLIYNSFGYYADDMFAHTFYPQLKSVALANEKRWSRAFAKCRSNRFRATTDLLCTGFLHPHVAQLEGKALFTKTRLFYFNIRKRTALRYYSMLLAKKGHDSIPFSMCPNDRSSDDSQDFPEYAEELKSCLEKFYNTPSPYEMRQLTSEEREYLNAAE